MLSACMDFKREVVSLQSRVFVICQDIVILYFQMFWKELALETEAGSFCSLRDPRHPTPCFPTISIRPASEKSSTESGSGSMSHRNDPDRAVEWYRFQARPFC